MHLVVIALLFVLLDNAPWIMHGVIWGGQTHNRGYANTYSYLCFTPHLCTFHQSICRSSTRYWYSYMCTSMASFYMCMYTCVIRVIYIYTYIYIHICCKCTSIATAAWNGSNEAIQAALKSPFACPGIICFRLFCTPLRTVDKNGGPRTRSSPHVVTARPGTWPSGYIVYTYIHTSVGPIQ